MARAESRTVLLPRQHGILAMAVMTSAVAQAYGRHQRIQGQKTVQSEKKLTIGKTFTSWTEI